MSAILGTPGSNQGNGFCLKNISDISWKILSLFLRLIDFLVCVKNRIKQVMPVVTLLVFVFYDGNRAHFTQIGERIAL